MAYAAGVPRAIVLGGNGQVGSAAALKLVSAGWDVISSGQTETRFPQDLRDAGVRFIQSDRYAPEDLRQLLHEGADVVVDCVGYTAEHVRMLLCLDHSRFRRQSPKWYDGLRGENREWDQRAGSTPRSTRPRL
jgi:NAD(P)-dependent dehydrogenase (short-subunit alcohol dehydrogenase family)